LWLVAVAREVDLTGAGNLLAGLSLMITATAAVLGLKARNGRRSHPSEEQELLKKCRDKLKTCRSDNRKLRRDIRAERAWRAGSRSLPS
jgi:hypothetical protein